MVMERLQWGDNGSTGAGGRGGCLRARLWGWVVGDVEKVRLDAHERGATRARGAGEHQHQRLDIHVAVVVLLEDNANPDEASTGSCRGWRAGTTPAILEASISSSARATVWAIWRKLSWSPISNRGKYFLSPTINIRGLSRRCCRVLRWSRIGTILAVTIL